MLLSTGRYFGGSAAGGGDTDPYWSNVVLMLGFDGQADGATTFTDESPFGASITATDNAQIDTSVSKFGDGSLVLDGDNDFLSIPSSAEFSVANAFDKTFEGWVYPADLSHQNVIYDKRSAGEFSMGVQTTGAAFFNTYGNTPLDVNLESSAGLVAANTWTHLAACRASSVWSLFVNGVFIGSQAESFQPYGTSNIFRIGKSGFSGSSRIFEGYMDELRVTHNVARYNANFTPPTTKFPRS